MSEKQKKLWLNLLAILCIVIIGFMLATYNDKPRTQESGYDRYKFITISSSYDDANGFQKIVCDPETNVLYMMVNGNIVTPLYNADGSLRTYQPEE